LILHTIYRLVITQSGEACEWSCWTLYFTIILLFVYFFFMIDFIAPLAFLRLLPAWRWWDVIFSVWGLLLIQNFFLVDFSRQFPFLKKSKTHHTSEEIQKEKGKISANWNSVNLIDVYFFTTSIKLTIKYNFLSFE
jgi:hypothetical protein